MKKILSLLLTLIVSSCFVACNVSVEVTPVYSNTYSSNETLHWRNQINGKGRTDVGEHIDDGSGTCAVCEYVIYVQEYSNTWSFNDTHHWKAQLNGNGKKDLAEHVNDSGRCKQCNYYYDATEFISFEKCKIGNVEGYRVMELYDEYYDSDYIYHHIEIPTYYQGEDDEKPLPVISLGYGSLGYGTINGHVYNEIKLKSVKLNEGLLEIQDWVFNNSEITELVIPNSVTNEYFKNPWGQNTYSTIYNICGGCKIKRFIMGDGLKVLASYNFGNGVKEVKLSNSLTTIKPRAFYEIYTLDYLVIPASVKNILEGTITGSGNYAKAAAIRMLPAGVTTPIFMEITKAEHDANVVPVRKRDLQGNVLDPISYGFVDGWSSDCPVYFKGEWRYDKNGKPIPY